MKKYVLIGYVIDSPLSSRESFVLEYFDAENDKEAEEYIEDNYSQDDGPMKLCKLECLVEWS